MKSKNSVVIAVSLLPTELKEIDNWLAKQSPKISRSAAIVAGLKLLIEAK